MSTATAVAITSLVIVVIGLAITLAIVLSRQTSETSESETSSSDSSSDTSSSSSSSSTSSSSSSSSTTDIDVSSKAEASVTMTETKSCMIKGDDNDETILIGDPWYLDSNNPKRCFAPAGQKCCSQINLPGGEEGCMIDFTGYNAARIADWKTDCLGGGGPLDMDKLALINTSFSGDWFVLQKDGVESRDDTDFNIEISGVNLKLKKDDTIYGVYGVSDITVNPKKQLKATYTSDIGSKTDIVIDEDGTDGLMLRVIDTPANSSTGQLTTYKLTKL